MKEERVVKYLKIEILKTGYILETTTADADTGYSTVTEREAIESLSEITHKVINVMFKGRDYELYRAGRIIMTDTVEQIIDDLNVELRAAKLTLENKSDETKELPF